MSLNQFRETVKEDLTIIIGNIQQDYVGNIKQYYINSVCAILSRGELSELKTLLLILFRFKYCLNLLIDAGLIEYVEPVELMKNDVCLKDNINSSTLIKLSRTGLNDYYTFITNRTLQMQ